MLISGTLIRGAAEASPRPVDALQTGDPLLDPLTGATGRLTCIRWRDLEFSVAGIDIFTEMRPIHIAQGALGAGVPETDVHVSPGQTLLVAGDKTRRGVPHISAMPARDLLGRPGVSIDRTRDRCRYFALFTETRQNIFAAGLVLPTSFTLSSDQPAPWETAPKRA